MKTNLNIDGLLKSLNACTNAAAWASGKSWKTIYETCERGDWLLWLFQKINANDLQLLTLTKGHCANTVRHLMKDKRSINAVDIAISFGEGKCTKEELDAAYAAADDAAKVANAAVYFADADAAYATIATYAAYAVYTNIDSTNVAYITAYIAEKDNQKLTADICRKYLPIEIWNINK